MVLSADYLQLCILSLQGWNKLTLELWTHAREGLTENDFIMAAKINELPLADLLKTKAAKA